MAPTAHVPESTSDRLDRLDAEYRKLKAILDDPLQLLDRLMELEIQRRAAEREAER